VQLSAGIRQITPLRHYAIQIRQMCLFTPNRLIEHHPCTACTLFKWFALTIGFIEGFSQL
jgi:hypothetical protein